MPEEPRIAAAAAVASTYGRKRGPNAVEAAMNAVIVAAHRETDVIWARRDLTVEEKRAMVAAMIEPEAMKRRVMAAREAVKAAR